MSDEGELGKKVRAVFFAGHELTANGRNLIRLEKFGAGQYAEERQTLQFDDLPAVADLIDFVYTELTALRQAVTLIADWLDDIDGDEGSNGELDGHSGS